MTGNGDPRRNTAEETVQRLRADVDRARTRIDQTVTEIEARLAPDRLRQLVGERWRDASAPWRDRPGEQLEALSRETMTRLREMAWMNPLGLGLAALLFGYLIGRRVRPR